MVYQCGVKEISLNIKVWGYAEEKDIFVVSIYRVSAYYRVCLFLVIKEMNICWLCCVMDKMYLRQFNIRWQDDRWWGFFFPDRKKTKRFRSSCSTSLSPCTYRHTSTLPYALTLPIPDPIQSRKNGSPSLRTLFFFTNEYIMFRMKSEHHSHGQKQSIVKIPHHEEYKPSSADNGNSQVKIM